MFKHSQQRSQQNNNKTQSQHGTSQIATKSLELTPSRTKMDKLSISEGSLQRYIADGDEVDSQSEEIVSSPLPPSELRRGGRISAPLLATQPGAVRVQGISPSGGGLSQDSDNDESSSFYSDEQSRNFQTPLVNAELVVQPDEVIPALPIMRSATEATITTNHIPAEIFEATPVNPQEEHDKPQPKLSELLQNTTVRIVLVVLILIILGLIVGVILGLSTRQVVIEVEDEGELDSFFQSVSSDNDD
ncbi:expressed unknown protein [Seminavis robusta]|uniref:Uncharacterized protein n=1 Tax=Seminavis robusta TaxID=568900 RepID=A0A9N8EIC8_9STRA|nr:expressed unknown protein [Seminavis robusta]|eukprot:Sro1048_g235220.1 n/a (246) ;mRNA; r:16122-16859